MSLTLFDSALICVLLLSLMAEICFVVNLRRTYFSAGATFSAAVVAGLIVFIAFVFMGRNSYILAWHSAGKSYSLLLDILLVVGFALFAGSLGWVAGYHGHWMGQRRGDQKLCELDDNERTEVIEGSSDRKVLSQASTILARGKQGNDELQEFFDRIPLELLIWAITRRSFTDEDALSEEQLEELAVAFGIDNLLVMLEIENDELIKEVSETIGKLVGRMLTRPTNAGMISIPTEIEALAGHIQGEMEKAEELRARFLTPSLENAARIRRLHWIDVSTLSEGDIAMVVAMSEFSGNRSQLLAELAVAWSIIRQARKRLAELLAQREGEPTSLGQGEEQ